MNFGFSEEQEHLRSEVRKYLDAQCPIDRVRELAKEPQGYSREHWKSLSELGWTGLITPEEHGGSQLGWVDLVVLLEETGRSLFPSPLVSTLLTTSLIRDLGSDAQQQRWLPSLADGSTIGALAIFDEANSPGQDGIRLQSDRQGEVTVLSGEKPRVIDAPSATLFAIAFRDPAGEIALALIESTAPGIEVGPTKTLDETKRIGTLRLDSVEINDADRLGAPGAAAAAIDRVLDRAALAETAESVGAGEAALALTVQYALDRVQFGRPIGQFQGVKHPLADMYVDLECTKSLLYYSAWALDESPGEVAISVSKAKAMASEAFMRMACDCVQLHGAIGYTEACDIQLYLRRSKWFRAVHGDENHHLDRIASLGGL
jgi:alkylation response protein AidB-like acyl-CoA dehydrogenase